MGSHPAIPGGGDTCVQCANLEGLIYIYDTRDAVFRSAAATLPPGSLLEMQNVRPHHRPTESDSAI